VFAFCFSPLCRVTSCANAFFFLAVGPSCAACLYPDVGHFFRWRHRVFFFFESTAQSCRALLVYSTWPPITNDWFFFQASVLLLSFLRPTPPPPHSRLRNMAHTPALPRPTKNFLSRSFRLFMHARAIRETSFWRPCGLFALFLIWRRFAARHPAF